MLINPSHLAHWINCFFGYGSWSARLWFVGYEEGGGDQPEEVAAKINYFSEVHQGTVDPVLCDIRELYKRVPYPADGPKGNSIANLYEHRFDKQAALHGAWKNLIAFAHSYSGKRVPELLKYQKSTFLSQSTANEALIQFYPLPSPHNHAWYYSWLEMPSLSFIKTRESYESHLYPTRIRAILEKVQAHQPDLVLMYGMNNINALKESVSNIFPAARFRLVKAVKMKIPQHHLADLNKTRLVITTQVPTLRHNRVESGFDWEAFGRMTGK